MQQPATRVHITCWDEMYDVMCSSISKSKLELDLAGCKFVVIDDRRFRMTVSHPHCLIFTSFDGCIHIRASLLVDKCKIEDTRHF